MVSYNLYDQKIVGEKRLNLADDTASAATFIPLPEFECTKNPFSPQNNFAPFFNYSIQIINLLNALVNY